MVPLPIDTTARSAFRTLRALGGFRIEGDESQRSLWLGESEVTVKRVLGHVILDESKAVVACIDDNDFPSGILIIGASGRQAWKRGGEPRDFAVYALDEYVLIRFSSDRGGTGQTRQTCELWTYDSKANAFKDSLFLPEVYEDFAPDVEGRFHALRASVQVVRRNRQVLVVYDVVEAPGTATHGTNYVLSDGHFVRGEIEP